MNLKSLQTWFKKNIKDQGRPYTLDKHQARIVLDSHKNTLVTARAGSGKTRTIVAKVVYLIAHEKISPENIIIFAFNRKAKTEVNERLAQITYRGKPLFSEVPNLATTFHAFAFKLTYDNSSLITEEESDKILLKLLKTTENSFSSTSDYQKLLASAKQFIARAEQQFFKDYDVLSERIKNTDKNQGTLEFFEKILRSYHKRLESAQKINFNQLINLASKKLQNPTCFEYIFIDEYQDFSLLFLTLVKSLRKTCKKAHLLAVGDDWQAINRFAGGSVEYFKNFKKYFPEDSVRLFIPTNYRSGKKIVKNANFFMSSALKDFNGCKAGNKLKSSIFVGDISKIKIPLNQKTTTKNHTAENRLIFKQYKFAVEKIIAKNPQKSIKILSRNNDLSFMPLKNFVDTLTIPQNPAANVSSCTIHKSKGLEADIVILLEIDAGKFPSPDRSKGLYEIFGDTEKTLLEDERRLFYVALTRAKEKLYVLTRSVKKPEKSAKKHDFLSYLNENFYNLLF